MHIEQCDVVIENLSEVIDHEEADTRLVCGIYDKTKRFRIERNLQEQNLLYAFVSDDALKHRNVRHPRDVQDPRFLLLLIISPHAALHSKPKSCGLLDPLGDVSRFFNRTDQQRPLLILFRREERISQMLRNYEMAEQKNEVKYAQKPEQQ